MLNFRLLLLFDPLLLQIHFLFVVILQFRFFLFHIRIVHIKRTYGFVEVELVQEAPVL